MDGVTIGGPMWIDELIYDTGINTNTYQYIPRQAYVAHADQIDYRKGWVTKDGGAFSVPVLKDGTVKIDLAAFEELLIKAGIINGPA